MSYKDEINYETDDDGIEFLDDEAYDIDDLDDEDELDIYDDDDDDEEELNEQLDTDVDYVKIHKELTKKPTLKSELWGFIKMFAVAFIIAYITTTFIVMNAEVPTGSMKDTIMEGDRLIGLRLSYVFSGPERGDVVIFTPPHEDKYYIKRVIGIPGDVVQIINGSLYVNSVLQEEPYIREPMVANGENMVFIVPEDCYFMMGDNRNNSSDSRAWTIDGIPSPYVPRDKIHAKALFKYYNKESKSFLDAIDFEIID